MKSDLIWVAGLDIRPSLVVVDSVSQASSPSPSGESDDEVLVSQVGDKGVFTMNRPKVLNALSINMIRRMTAQLKVHFIDNSLSGRVLGFSLCCMLAFDRLFR